MAMPRRMTVQIVLLLSSITVNVFCCERQEQMYLTLNLKVLQKPEFCFTQEVSGAMSMKKSANT